MAYVWRGKAPEPTPKPSRREYNRQWHEENKDRVNAERRRKYAETKDRLNARRRELYAKKAAKPLTPSSKGV